MVKEANLTVSVWPRVLKTHSDFGEHSCASWCGAVHPAAAEEGLVGGVDHSIDLFPGDVALHRLDSRVVDRSRHGTFLHGMGGAVRSRVGILIHGAENVQGAEFRIQEQ